MKLTIKVREVDWWFWAITLGFIIAALMGWVPGYYAVMILSGIQIIYFAAQERSLRGFQTQVRIVYFAVALLGLSELLRIPIYILLAIGTVMVVFLDRCGIALVLKMMPWNRGLAPGATCDIREEN